MAFFSFEGCAAEVSEELGERKLKYNSAHVLPAPSSWLERWGVATAAEGTAADLLVLRNTSWTRPQGLELSLNRPRHT